ncbi:MAG: dihydroorotase [Burkholderiales bacterium]|nr:dihydroorotase [Burkholderiales bacterium]
MTLFKNVTDLNHKQSDIHIADGKNIEIDGSKLLSLPGLIDPHVHFRVPGLEHKEDWCTGAKAALKGGYSYVFDMPNTIPPTTTQERLDAKINLINQQLNQVKLPLKYRLFFGADKNNFNEINKVKDYIIGIKVFMGSSTGDLLMDDLSSLHAIYAIAAKFNLIIALHAEDEKIVKHNTQKYLHQTEFKYHSLIRSVEAATTAVELVIELTKIYNVRSYVLHVSTKEELELIKQAKQINLPVYAETCPHYLFLDDEMYDKLHGLGKMNPPLRKKINQQYLWDAIAQGYIDTIGSDHAPHSLAEKDQLLHQCPSGVPGIETTLPLMLTAYKNNKITLPNLINLLHYNPKRIFALDTTDDIVLANIVDYKQLENKQLCTKVGWSPYAGMNLTGYPEFFISNSQIYDLQAI